MWNVLHIPVVGDNNLSAIFRETSQPRNIVLRLIIGIARYRRVVLRALDFKNTADQFLQLPFVGEGLKDPYHCERNVLVERYLHTGLCSLTQVLLKFDSFAHVLLWDFVNVSNKACATFDFEGLSDSDRWNVAAL